jgi:hypothetical protein
LFFGVWGWPGRIKTVDENPYESPKELPSQPTLKAGVGIGLLLLLSIPAGCVCGGITCGAIGLTSYLSPRQVGPEDHGQLLGFVLGFVVAVVVSSSRHLSLWKAEG